MKLIDNAIFSKFLQFDIDENIPIYEVNYISTKDNTKKTVKAILNNIISDQKSLEALVTLGYGNDVEKVKTLLEEKNKNIIITPNIFYDIIILGKR